MRKNWCFGLASAALLSFPAVLAAKPADSSGSVDCKKAVTQIDLDTCAGRDFQTTDRKLNEVYRNLLNGADAKTAALLRTAERNWLTFRDSECDLETAGSEGGSIYPMEYSLCLKDKTAARIKELLSQESCGTDAGCERSN